MARSEKRVRRFYRQVFEVEVLTEDGPLGDTSINGIQYAITDGGASGEVTMNTVEEVTAAQMATLLNNQGSDSGFFGLDDDGNDLMGP